MITYLEDVSNSTLWEQEKKYAFSESDNVSLTIPLFDSFPKETTMESEYFKETDSVTAYNITLDNVLNLFERLCHKDSELGGPYLYRNQEQLNLLAYRLTGRQIPVNSNRIIWRGSNPQLSTWINRLFSNHGDYAKGNRFFVLDGGNLYNSKSASSEAADNRKLRKKLKDTQFLQ